MSALSEQTRERIRAEFAKYPNKRAATLPALHIVQDEQRQVSTEALREVAELLELHPAEVNDTLSFYGFFRNESDPLGKHRVWICRSLSCALRGGEELLSAVCGAAARRAGRDDGRRKGHARIRRVPGGLRGGTLSPGERRLPHEHDGRFGDKLIQELK